MSKKVILPSGAELMITLSPFAVSKALYQAVMEEGKSIKVDTQAEVYDLVKNIFCTGFSSKKIESCLDECMKRVTYNGRKVDNDTWEPVEARGDYITATYEVAKENILPFLKNLYAEYSVVLEMLQKAQS
jgi:hypothetical protein